MYDQNMMMFIKQYIKPCNGPTAKTPNKVPHMAYSSSDSASYFFYMQKGRHAPNTKTLINIPFLERDVHFVHWVLVYVHRTQRHKTAERVPV
jgi:hypothetical protein